MIRFLVLAGASVIAAPALADIHFYGGAGVIGTGIESRGLADAAAQEGIPASGKLDDTGTGYQVYVGTMFNENFGVELKYSDSGDAEADITAVSIGSGDVFGRGDVSASIDGFTIYGVARQPLWQRLDLVLKAGWTVQDIDADAGFTVDDETFSVSASDDDDGLAISAGLRYNITDNFSIGAEFEYLGVSFDTTIDEPYRAGLNVEFHLR